MKELMLRTLNDPRQFTLTLRIMLISAFVLGFAIGFASGALVLK